MIDAQEVVRLYIEEKLSTLKIAERLSCSTSYVKELLLRSGVEMRGQGGTRAGQGYVPRKIDAEKIRQSYLSGLSSLEIAKQEGCSPFAVKHALHAMGVQMRGNGGKRTEKTFGFVPTKEWLEQAMAAFNGVAVEVARHYGFNYYSVINYLDKFGIPRNRPGVGLKGCPSPLRQDIPIEEAIEFSNAGWDYQQLADRYGVSYGVIVRRMQQAGYTAPYRRPKNPLFPGISFSKRKILQELNILVCEICSQVPVAFCHTKPRHLGGPVETTNCLVLCHNCHHQYDHGQLTQEQFEKIKGKVRLAEQTYNWVNESYANFL